MFGIESLAGNAQAAVLVSVVLVEAMVLYVGYGALTRALGPSVQRLIGGE
ncbi:MULTISPECIES: DUF7512 family protein [Haloferax]|uniref:Uncharacterized protein n=1 Tax=Haloferax mediterranei (strain ATCC 33500 / DSM 1411 / JCM 8866 / NBRC 14739 / NCIMB 2177 / R-4) TaxID=523841 RepID=M0J6H0_HALMT|nr:hypothetical protein [Haloferax mediterranei]EMA03948.1 hypothetical protein C439_03283 [Haloferax mediterranei ATCC 33500]MDX5989248.1 hypothetical protein [Haloferax mediterranei ATCC 33500]